MNTPTHALINWTAAKAVPVESFPTSAVLLGSVAPDIPLYFLSIGGGLYYRFVKGEPVDRVGEILFQDLFYNDPWWVSLHNVLHSPTVLIALLAGLYFSLGREAFAGSWWVWFCGSCLLHTLVDIPVHHDDGPLIFWPLNRTYRFASPVSYWDPAHYARIVMPLEGLLAVGLALRIWWTRS
ncbi:MAG: metal-dependent hydrolase [Planctomycetota bacterium]